MNDQHSEHDFCVIQAMKTYGGSFVKALAECFILADSTNYAKLKIAFQDYWKQYEQMLDRKSA